MSTVVAEMEKSWNEKILFSLTEFKGKSYADVRVYYEDDEGELQPTKKGITITLDRFAEFKKNLQALEEFLSAEGHL